MTNHQNERPTESPSSWRRLPVGAELAPDGGAHFRVWAPARRSVDLVLYGRDAADGESTISLARDGEYFSGFVREAKASDRYRFRLDGGNALADPVSRFQPEGPHGPSELIDSSFRWTDSAWPGPAASPVLYEIHVGTFTTPGTWTAAKERLRALAELGITVVEIMPVAEFSGRFGWGYDGVNLFAPYHEYGTPDDFRDFVNHAHELGVAVILDVVYNHFGPDGNSTTQFSMTYCTENHATDWGPAINFYGPGSHGTREFYLSNAAYWIDEFHLDGLRLDATQNIYDQSPVHILREVTDIVRRAAGRRRSYVIAENESQDVRLLRAPECNGFGIDAAWNDDWHHSAMVALAGRDEAYLLDYDGKSREFVAAAKYGYLYQGQWYGWQQRPRGTSGLDLVPAKFVHFLENHDQVANSYRGNRLYAVASGRRVRALTALLLLGPQTPMLFQGQEFGSLRPFLYFADHEQPLAGMVRDGRLEFLSQFQSIAPLTRTAPPADPADRATFERCKLDDRERVERADVLQLHHDLLAIRRDDPGISRPTRVDAATLTEDAFLLRYVSEHDDRLLIVNLGGPLHFHKMPEPLLAPPTLGRWRVTWCSEDPQYGGGGLPSLDTLMKDWTLPGGCAVLFRATSETDA